MSWWFCCCKKRPCAIFTDNFNRADDTDLGDDWVESVGDSEIISQQLSMPAGAIVRTVIEHPVVTPTGFASIVIRQPLEVGDIYRVLLNVTKDIPPAYSFAQYEVTSDTQGTLSVGTSGGGIADSVTAGHTGLDNDNSLTICRTVEGVFGGVGSASTTAWACIANPGGRHAGIMNNSASNTITVDDFFFYETQHTNPDPSCKNCDCECEGHCLPKTLTLTIVASDCCSCMNGETVTLTFDANCLPDFVWRGSKTVCIWSDCVTPGTHDFSFALTCNPDAEGHWELGVILQTPCDVAQQSFTVSCDPAIDDAIFSVSEACDPFELVFPNINCFGSPPDPPNCDHHFVITE